MANRHANKKLRALARARMAATGESYQRALTRLRIEHATRRNAISVDLIECNYHGTPLTLATFLDPRLPRVVVMPQLPSEQRHRATTPLFWILQRSDLE